MWNKCRHVSDTVSIRDRHKTYADIFQIEFGYMMDAEQMQTYNGHGMGAEQTNTCWTWDGHEMDTDVDTDWMQTWDGCEKDADMFWIR